jgi:hypothetical protein
VYGGRGEKGVGVSKHHPSIMLGYVH